MESRGSTSRARAPFSGSTYPRPPRLTYSMANTEGLSSNLSRNFDYMRSAPGCAIDHRASLNGLTCHLPKVLQSIVGELSIPVDDAFRPGPVDHCPYDPMGKQVLIEDLHRDRTSLGQGPSKFAGVHRVPPMRTPADRSRLPCQDSGLGIII